MSYFFRKFIALLMLLWLPLFTGSALAASIAMQMEQGGCQPAMSHAEKNGDIDHHSSAANTSSDEESSSCAACNFACTGYLSVSHSKMGVTLASVPEYAHLQSSFRSHYSAPLAPPPLARI